MYIYIYIYTKYKKLDCCTYGNFLKLVFFQPSGFFDRIYPLLASSNVNFVLTDIIL